jgi:hypothetical protein
LAPRVGRRQGRRQLGVEIGGRDPDAELAERLLAQADRRTVDPVGAIRRQAAVLDRGAAAGEVGEVDGRRAVGGGDEPPLRRDRDPLQARGTRDGSRR